ncbi:MAG: recombination mediator RecR [Chitinophagales bacterium]|nr:recombination protein RecR [Bacteroidota bacterium]MCB9043527.1 recombination protein RecR [Chitinophagales bacterium]
MNFSSKLIEQAVAEFSRLPGIGKKTALRLVLHLLKQSTETVDIFTQRISDMRHQIKYCQKCCNISDDVLCNICANTHRKHETICVVENLRDVIAIESTQQYQGVYHVLGGVISPVDGIGPDQLNVQALLNRLQKEPIDEIIMALSPTMEGDTTIFYLSRKLHEINPSVKISALARGVAFGGELEYVDELTLARAMATRRPYEQFLVSPDK